MLSTSCTLLPVACTILCAGLLWDDALGSDYPTRFEASVAVAVDGALRSIDAHREEQLGLWIRIAETAAPSRREQQRAALLKAEMEKLELSDIRIDEIGNLTGVRKGTGGGPTVVFAAHMDTVFGPDVPIKVRSEGGRLHAPGVFDNSASLANMLAAVRAMNEGSVQTRGDVIFIGTVQEEVGLHGMRAWLRDNPGRADMVIALDGELGPVLYGALGVRWLKFVFSAQGAHTNVSRDQPNPIRAVAEAVSDLYSISLPGADAEAANFSRRDFAVYNVGQINGGAVFNAIPTEAWFTVDIRANDANVLAKLTERATQAAQRAAANQRVRVDAQWVQDSASGGTAEQLESKRTHPLVQTGLDVLEYLQASEGSGIKALPTGSTDANAAVAQDIPAISVGRSYGGGQHSLEEWADIESAYLGAKQIILLAVSLAELSQVR